MIMILIVMSVSFSYAQFKPDVEMTPDEKELFKNSLESFEEEDYLTSLQGFSQLLSLFPREPVFNFLYGASMVEMNSDIKKAFDYLEFSAARGVGESYYYIGLGYHFLYDFDNAIGFYELFKENVKEKHWDEYEINKHIERAENGKNLIKYAYELQVLSNKQIGRKNFYYSYDLDNFGGEIIVKPEQFKDKGDKKIDNSDLMYISNIQNIVLLSSYGDSRKNSLDLYISYKTSSGWSDPQKLPETINTPYDEAYPFLSEDGTTLYFASKGHNSIGGYDIFKSFYNSKDNTWSKPENLDFPINTPFDEIMFATDRFNETAYFASARESGNEEIGVYRILLEKNPLTRQLANIDDIYQSATLNIDPTAMAELTKRQEIRASTMIDTSGNRIETYASNDTSANNENLIAKSFNLLDDKKSDAEEFLEYSAAAYEICELKIEEIEKLNKKINNLRNKTDQKSVELRDSLNRILIEESMLVAEMYDLAKYFYDNGNQINGLIDYYDGELGLLSDITDNEQLLNEKTENLYNEIQNINTKDPIPNYKKNIDSDIDKKSETLLSYQNSLDTELEKLKELNDKIEVKLDLAKKEEDFEVREKYIYDVKTYENSKIDLISEIKELEVQVEFLNYEISQLQQRKTIIDNKVYDLDNSLVANPELDLSKINNEIELIKTHISQNSLRELSYKQDIILADKSYYSEEVDLDAILYAGPDLTNMGLDEILIDTKTYTDKYKDILSENTLKTGDLVFKNDSLKDQISYLESEFDNAETTVEQQHIIDEINKLTGEINQNNSQITEYLDSQAKVDVNIYMSEFESLKNNSGIGPQNPEVLATEELIAESQNLQTDIDDLKLIGANEDNPPILYLEGMKSEIDNLIIEKIETLKAQALIADNNISDSEIFDNVETELRNVKPDFDPVKFEEITDGFAEIEKIYKNANKEKDPVKKNDLINEANEKLDYTINSNIQFLNDQLVREYAVFNLFETNYTKLNETPEYNQLYLDKVNTLKTEAANLQMEAEETTDDIAKMQNLTKAWEKLQLANEYYDYIFDISADERKYKDNYEIKPEKSKTEFIAASTEVVRIEPVEIETIDIADNNNNTNITDTINNDIADNNTLITDTSTNVIAVNDTEITDTSSNAIAVNDTIITDTSTNLIADNNTVVADTSSNPISDNNTVVSDTSNNIADNNIVTDTSTNNIADNNTAVTDTSSNLIADNNTVLTDTSSNNIAINENNNTETNTNINDTNSQNELDLSETIEKLEEVNYQGRVAINISSQSKQIEDLANLDEDINILNDKIVNTNNRNKKEKLQTELKTKQEEQIDAIIEYSITSNEILAELDSISQFNNDFDRESLDSLKAIQFDLRNSIVNYSNFYTADEITDKHNQAEIVELELFDIYNDIISSTESNVLAENLTPVETNDINTIENNTSITEVSEPDFSTAGNYTYEYPFDDKEESNLTKLETKISELETEIQEKENVMAGIEETMNSLNNLDEYKKLQKQLQKENKKYLKQIKNWAKLKKESLSLQYDMADNHYYDTQSTNSNVTEVSDSLKYVSDDQVNESLALFEVIITYNAKTADDNFIETYQKANTLSVEGINTINAANSLKSDGNENDPIVIAHYRSTSTDNNDNIIETSDTSFIADNNIIVDTIAVDTLPTNDTALIADNTNDNNNDANNNNNTDTNNNTDSNNTENNNDAETNSNDLVIRNFDTSNVFDANSGSFYSDTNPITGIPNSDGLVYRVQIAAFNGKVANNRFIGMKPVFWEEIPNSALVRYIVGNFIKYDDAGFNLPTIRGMGYPDAFIVAYYNGARIPIYEARRIEEREAQELIANNDNGNNNANNGNDTNNIDNNANTNNDDIENNINIETNNETNIELETTDITQTNGVFFCVQIGVYATQLSSDRLFGLSPIMYHNYAGNLIRHTFGKYYDFNTAINEQNKIRRLGIPDAFVVAYYNGEKITINQARELLANEDINTNENEILVNIPDNQIPINPPVNDNQNDNNDQPQVTVEYYVQIGVFRNDVNNFVRDSFDRMSGDNQLIRLTNNNMTLYRIGTFTSYQDAQNTLAGVQNSGIGDAFIVAFVNGKRVNLNQARAVE